MATPLRPADIADLLKLLVQSTADSTPDNPAEQLSDYVGAPPVGSDAIALTDTLTLPFTPHNSTYVWTDPTGASKWNRGQWS